MNKYKTYPIQVLKARLDVLLSSLNDTYQNNKMTLETDLVSLYHEAINLFFSSLDKSVIATSMDIRKGFPTDPELFNKFTSSAQQDLEIIFNETNALSSIITAQFNSILSEYNQAVKVNKEVDNRIGDYLLYADPALGAGYFFGDSFNILNKTDIASELLAEEDECFIDDNEGVVLLPVENQNFPEVESIIINNISNGTVGNNFEVDKTGHKDIESISDGEPNTWFEYEKITSFDSNIPLILDVTIKLKEKSVINHIHINPINFGTPTLLKIINIDTSVDGTEFISIKDEIPVVDFLSEPEENIFILSPATSKSAGQGFYSFQARKAQYINIRFEQHTPYNIQTASGEKLRYAIGLRDINIVQRKFKSSGSLISKPFNINDDVKKVSLWASENPTEESILANVYHFISHNDGGIWSPVQPQQRVGSDIPEIVNYNNIADNAVITEDTVNTFRHKIFMNRNTDAFSSNSNQQRKEIEKLDILNIPVGNETELSLSEQPIKNTINLLLPYKGSFSCPRARYGTSVADESVYMDLDSIQFNIDVPGTTIVNNIQEGSIRYKLPFRNIPNLEHRIRVFINGAQIEYVSKNENFFTNSPTSYTTIDENSRVYFLNKNGQELQFGFKDSTGTQRGFVPQAGSRMDIVLDGDNPSVRLTEQGYILDLTSPSDGDRDNIYIVASSDFSEDDASIYEIEIPPGTEGFRSVLSSNNRSSLIGKPISNIGTSDKQIPNRPAKRSTSRPNNPVQTTSSIKENLPQPSKEFAVAAPKTEKRSKQEENRTTTILKDEFDGVLPPVFLSGTSNFEVYEYDLITGDLITGVNRWFTDKVTFIDGDSELRDSSFDKVEARYTFDHTTGTVYLGSKPRSDRKTVLSCKKINIKPISQDLWDFNTDLNGKINTQQIILDPSVVYTKQQITTFTYSSTTDVYNVNLVSDNTKEHNWFNKKVVRGTVVPDISLFQAGVVPTEVEFIDGSTELSNIVQIENEDITFVSAGSNLYYFTLEQLTTSYPNNVLVGTPSFAAVRTKSSTFTTTNLFNIDGQQVSGTVLTSDGQWKIETGSGSTIVYLYSSSTPNEHVVSYRYKNSDPGIDVNGLYSIDYFNGTIYFSVPIADSGNITYEVSAYSGFYNLAEIVSEKYIKSINEVEQTITIESSFAIKFLKQNTIDNARPQIIKAIYSYFEKSTESLADLEPYWSPICKDVAFKAVTNTILEEL